MGKKKEEPPSNEATKPAVDEKETEEDTPVIKQLKVIDDRYCAKERELEREIEKLRQKYDEKQAPLLEERRKILLDASSCSESDKDAGTPGCPDFWITALGNAADIEECLHECDEPVLKYMVDLKKKDIDPEYPQKGTRIEFHFKENPYFTNTELFFEAHFDYDPETYKPYKELECIEVKACEIDWKPGKNVTVEKQAKAKPDKKGKKRPGKVKEEPVPSFFRILFQSLKKGDPLPEALEVVYDEEENDTDEMTEVHLDNIGGVSRFLSSDFLPYAVRYYTGEACDDDDDDDEESEEEDDDDDDDEESSSEDEPAPKAKGGKKKPEKPAAKKGDGGEKTEECKQQ